MPNWSSVWGRQCRAVAVRSVHTAARSWGKAERVWSGVWLSKGPSGLPSSDKTAEAWRGGPSRWTRPARSRASLKSKRLSSESGIPITTCRSPLVLQAAVSPSQSRGGVPWCPSSGQTAHCTLSCLIEPALNNHKQPTACIFLLRKCQSLLPVGRKRLVQLVSCQ